MPLQLKLRVKCPRPAKSEYFWQQNYRYVHIWKSRESLSPSFPSCLPSFLLSFASMSCSPCLTFPWVVLLFHQSSYGFWRSTQVCQLWQMELVTPRKIYKFSINTLQ